MAGLAVVNVIGVISGLLGIWSFAQDNFGDTDEGGSVVRIQVGLDTSNGLSNAGGDLPDVRLFNEAGEFLGGKYDPGSVDDGTTGDIKISQSAEQQAAYGLFTANDNAICIAVLSIVWPDEQKFGWTGDWGKACGGPWYYSNIVISGREENPMCMWIDANKDQPVTAFQLHFADFVSKDGQFPHDEDYYCNAGPPFKLYYDDDPNSITYWTVDKRDSRSMRIRDVSDTKASGSKDHAENPGTSEWKHHAKGQSKRSPFIDTRLVISGNANQSASDLCAHPASLGPDFFNVAEGQFCQMSSKNLYPVCGGDAGVTDNCFNSETQKLVIGGVSARDEEYTKVIDWTTTGSS